MVAEVVKNGELYSVEFARGKVVTPFKKVGKTDRPQGTSISFYPDSEIFKETIEFN
jgi:DNA gyrase subunit B